MCSWENFQILFILYYNFYQLNVCFSGRNREGVAQMVKKSVCNVGDLGSILGSGRFPGEGIHNPLQYSCLKNPHGQRSPAAIVHWVVESDMTG